MHGLFEASDLRFLFNFNFIFVSIMLVCIPIMTVNCEQYNTAACFPNIVQYSWIGSHEWNYEYNIEQIIVMVNV